MHRLVLLVGILMAFCMISCGGDNGPTYSELDMIPVVCGPDDVNLTWYEPGGDISRFGESINDPRCSGIII